MCKRVGKKRKGAEDSVEMGRKNEEMSRKKSGC